MIVPVFKTDHVRLFHGDCREVLRELPDASVDSVVTDPPYELGFMGKAWDAQGVAYDVDLWREVLRVLKPGGHLLAFGGTRTYHRMAVAIEDAGFEVRDSIHWLYGSGFPKSLDVSKAIDKQRHDRAEVETVVRWMEATRVASGVTRRQVEDAFGTVNIGQAFFTITPGSAPRVPTLEQVPVLLDLFGLTLDDVPDEVRRLLWDLNGRKGQPGENWLKREVTGTVDEWADRTNYALTSADGLRRDKAATPEAARWEGWGTALKPAHEPVVVARKPLSGTVAANVLAHGTGALNVDGCRIKGADAPLRWETPRGGIWQTDPTATATATADDRGRWPANVVLDPEAAEVLDRQSGDLAGAGAKTERPDRSPFTSGAGELVADTVYPDSGGASRFFTVAGFTDDDLTSFRYVAKPDRAERNAGLDGNFHPTVKPLDLMRWLVRLVTPPGGTVLEPFAGSGTTLAAAVLEGFDAIGIELTADYLPLIEGRVRWAEAEARFGPVSGPTKVRKDAGAPTLFD